MYTALDNGFGNGLGVMKQPSKRSIRRLFVIFFISFVVFVGLLNLLAYFGNSNAIGTNNRSASSSERTCILSDGTISPISTRYAVVIDAGSSGSRVHVYTFEWCGSTKLAALTSEFFQEITPGLSSWDRAEDAANSLTPLFEAAMALIKPELQKCTPIAVKATAGLRLLNESKAHDILNKIKEKLKSYPFAIADEGAVSIIDGSEEGVGAWMTINFLLDNLARDKPSALIIDLGGGSSQIAFQVPDTTIGSGNGQYVNLQFDGKSFLLYQHSYLGYGLNEARKKVLAEFMKISTEKHNTNFPCWLKNYSQVEADTIIFGSADDPQQCREYITRIFDFATVCPGELSCAFNGVHQPVIGTDIEIYGLSFIYDRFMPLVSEGSFTLEQAELLAVNACQARFNMSNPYENPYICLDLNYIIILLKEGFKIHPKKPIHLVKKIKGYETSWSLGSAISTLSSKQFCPAI